MLAFFLISDNIESHQKLQKMKTLLLSSGDVFPHAWPQVWLILGSMMFCIGIIGICVRPSWERRYALEPTETRKQNLESNPWRLVGIALLCCLFAALSAYVL